jgi:hypothetical protein
MFRLVMRDLSGIYEVLGFGFIGSIVNKNKKTQHYY